MRYLRLMIAATTISLALGTFSSTSSVSVEAIETTDPVIDSFEAVLDCITPDPRRPILSYHASNVSRLRIEAIHRGGRSRTFYTQGGRSLLPGIGATGIADPGATSDVEAYVLVATGAGGSEVRRRRVFRYRVAEFNLIGTARHARFLLSRVHMTKYEHDAQFANVDSWSCEFRFDAPIAGESGRVGDAYTGRHLRLQMLSCEIAWRSVRKARAGGEIEFIAHVTDPCTQGIISRRARVDAID